MNAADVYKRRAIESATPIGLIILLYEGILTGLRQGIAAIEAGSTARSIEARTIALNRVLSILAELRSVLDHKRGGEAAELFARLYQLAERNILEASVKQDSEPLRELLEPFASVQAAWRQADALPLGFHSVAEQASAQWDEPALAMAEAVPVAGRAGGGRLSWQA